VVVEFDEHPIPNRSDKVAAKIQTN
jgi:hypothetical protein